MHTALIITSEHSTRPLFGWFLKSEYLHSSQYASHPVILRVAEGKVAEPIIQRITLAPGEGGPSQTVGEGRTKTLSSTPHPPWLAPSLQGDCFPSLFETVDSATPGKPFVQNEMRLR